jgi:hypothetical protein
MQKVPLQSSWRSFWEGQLSWATCGKRVGAITGARLIIIPLDNTESIYVEGFEVWF